jgi:hypothetical protein
MILKAMAKRIWPAPMNAELSGVNYSFGRREITSLLTNHDKSAEFAGFGPRLWRCN